MAIPHARLDRPDNACPQAKKLRILIAEDDIQVGRLLEEVLAGMGHDVCAVEITEANAITAAARHKPDLMIVDARLGDGNGISAVTEILRTGPVPHLFVSGDSATVQARRPDAVVIQKPFRIADLVLGIQRTLEIAAIVKTRICRSRGKDAE